MGQLKIGDIIVTQYGDKIKLVQLKAAVGGVAVPSLCAPQREAAGEAKLANNLSRARNAVYELAACNPWEYFVTLTLDQSKRDRYDLGAFRRDFAQWLRNYNRLHQQSVKYLLIPERHKNGAWHMHGLLSGLSDSKLVKNRYGYLDWLDYSARFGYISLSKVRSHERVSAYVTKYITKDMSARLHDMGAHLYYASKGLSKSRRVGVFRLRSRTVPTWDFENDWVKVRWMTPDEFARIAPEVYTVDR